MELRELRTAFNETKAPAGDVIEKFKKAVGNNGISLLKHEPGLLVKGDKVMLIFNVTPQSVSLTPEDVKQLVRKKILKKDFIMRDGKRTWKRGPFDMVRFLNTQLRATRDHVIPRHDSDIQKEKDKDHLWLLKDMRKKSEAEAKGLEALLQGDMVGYTLFSDEVYDRLTGNPRS